MITIANWNELFYGIKETSAHNRTRYGGLYYIAEARIGGHTPYTRLLFALLTSAAYDRDQKFLNTLAKPLCKFLGLNYVIVRAGIEYLWNKDAANPKLMSLGGLMAEECDE